MMKRQSPGTSTMSKKLKVSITVIISALCISFLIHALELGTQGTLFASEARAENEAEEPSMLDDQFTGADLDGGFAEFPDEEIDEPALFSVFETDPLESLSQSLRTKQRELDEREKELAEREERLKALEKEVNRKLARIEETYQAMQRFSGAAEEQRRQEIGKWVKIYQAMKAPQAAEVFADLDQSLALEIIVRMDPKKAGKLLDEMVKNRDSQEKAAELANALADLRP